MIVYYRFTNTVYLVSYNNNILLCSKLHHPNIVGILDVSVANGQVTIVMPLVEGCSLYSMIFDFKHPRVCNT